MSKGKRPKLQQDIPSPTASAAVPADPRTAAELAGRRASPTDRLDAANSTLVVTLESRIDFHITECARHEAAIRELRMAIDAERETTAQLRAERERLKSRADSRGVADLLSLIGGIALGIAGAAPDLSGAAKYALIAAGLTSVAAGLLVSRKLGSRQS